MTKTALKRRFAGSLIAALLVYTAMALAVEVGSAQAGLGDDACLALHYSGAKSAVGPGGQESFELDGCGYSKCDIPFTDEDGITKCEYGRTAVVTLGRASSAKRAKKLIRKDINKGGYKPLNTKADLAGIVSGPPGGAVAMASRRVTVLFSLAAFSDDESNSPVWDNTSELKKDARDLARFLRSFPKFTNPDRPPAQ
jgi:hypothetical protein